MAASRPTIHIVGAGLAGSECAYQLAQMGYQVVLIEMRGQTMTPAHKTDQCAELVCSNSFGSLAATSAPGQLKWEAEQLGSLIVGAAFESRVPAGQALSMDREKFAQAVTSILKAHPNIKIETRAVSSLDEIPRPCVVATGPLTHEPLALDLKKHFGSEFLYFFDAIAPIISADSVNMDIAWKADRWDKGTKDYINCPLSKDEYFAFIDAVAEAKKIEAKDFEKNTPYFESCMPIEAMLDRGRLTLRFGPMKSIGLKDPKTGKIPFAAVQLRQDNKEATAYNMVGFQTKMAYADQKRVLRMIPGLENAEFLKLGSIHRNLYINTPKSLSRDLSSKHDPMLFFAGQITGVEGYFESTCVGMLVARFLDQKVSGAEYDAPPRASALGSILAAITDETKVDHFQPTNINFGAFPPVADDEVKAWVGPRRWDKNDKRALQVDKARKALTAWMTERNLTLQSSSKVERASQELIAATEAATAEASLT